MKTCGDPRWKSLPSYLDLFIPRVLDLLDELNLKITFFVVGQDASMEGNRKALALLSEKGHEVGNHSFHHEPSFHLSSRASIRNEIQEAEKHIILGTGQKPIGFRGPIFSWSPNCIDILAENGYLYDASSLPTYLGPLARAYYFAKSNTTHGQEDKRQALFGSFKNGMNPIQPYRWKCSPHSSLLEIPVTTIPFIKTPFHLSYLMYIAGYSQFLMHLYLKMAITLCLVKRIGVSFLLHPLDFLGADLVPELAFFPAMSLPSAKKYSIAKGVLKQITRYFTFVTMNEYAEFLLKKKNLKIYKLC
jgi:hypothetical protein